MVFLCLFLMDIMSIILVYHLVCVRKRETERDREILRECPSTLLTIGNRVETVSIKTKATRSVCLN